jgi:hypothetical protein
MKPLQQASSESAAFWLRSALRRPASRSDWDRSGLLGCDEQLASLGILDQCLAGTWVEC